jgi:predicted metal-dependent enzyme (double-stranded beta helix superfamily)
VNPATRASQSRTRSARAEPVRRLLAGVLGERDRWLATVRYNTADRWYGRLDISHLDGAAGYEAWLLSWLPGQRTDLHDHGGASGGFAVVSGSLREQSAAGDRLHTVTWIAGQHRLFGAHHIHQVGNVAPQPAISVHLYTPSLTTMTRYRWTGSGAELTAVERAGADW